MTPSLDKGICRVEGCGRPVLVQFCQLCRRHYQSENQAGNIAADPNPPGLPLQRGMTSEETQLFEDNLDVCEKVMRSMKVDPNYYRSVAQVTLMAATQKWKRDGSARLSTYAWTRIRYAILNYKTNDEFVFGKNTYAGMVAKAKAGDELHPSERIVSIDFLHDNGVQIDRSGRIVTSDYCEDEWDD